MSERKQADPNHPQPRPRQGRREFDVLALGELLIDFKMRLPLAPSLTQSSHSIASGINAAPSLHGDAGGAPANVLAAVSRLGGQAGFIGKVGRDGFGDFLASTLRHYGIDVTGLTESAEVLTTLAFVSLNADGERSFSFHRNPGADTQLSLDDIDLRLLQQTKVFHFGSLSLTSEPARSTTLAVAKAARQAGCIVSFDPNWRSPLWPHQNEAVEQMLRGIKTAHIVKVSEEELRLLTDTSDVRQGAMTLLKKGPELVLVTLGSEGCFYANRQDLTGRVPSIPVHAVDTTGAGDAFMGGFLWQVTRDLRQPVASWHRQKLEAAIHFANAVGALTASRSGTMSAMPSLSEVNQVLVRGTD